jgi:hypothetical protein
MAKQQKTNLPVAYDAELARLAQAYRDTEAASATGNFISVRGGVLQWRGAPIEGTERGAHRSVHDRINCTVRGS